MSRRSTSPTERALQAKFAAYKKWAHADPVAGTEAARAAFLRGFIDQVDPNRELPETERYRRAEAARRAHFTKLALKSVQARRVRKAASAEELNATNAGPTSRRSRKPGDVTSDVTAE